MIRKTSMDAFEKIKREGLLSKRRFEVYESLFAHGPSTCREVVKKMSKANGDSVSITYSSYSSRFSELRRLGVIEEVGEIIDPETNNPVILWDVTGSLPSHVEKPMTSKEKIAFLKATLEIAIKTLELSGLGDVASELQKNIAIIEE